MYGGGKSAGAFPYQLIELQFAGTDRRFTGLDRRFTGTDGENSKAAVGFTAGTQGAAGIDSRNAAKAFDTLHMRVSVYGDCTTEAFGCHTQFTSVKFNMMQMPVRQ